MIPFFGIIKLTYNTKRSKRRVSLLNAIISFLFLYNQYLLKQIDQLLFELFNEANILEKFMLYSKIEPLLNERKLETLEMRHCSLVVKETGCYRKTESHNSTAELWLSVFLVILSLYCYFYERATNGK